MKSVAMFVGATCFLVPRVAFAQIENVSEFREPQDEVIVTGVRPRGAVLGDIEAEYVFDAQDVEATGATTFAELLAELGVFTRSSSGRGGGGPVVLLNGQRISGFRELRNYPTEAIERVEVLPEEVALKYGYRSDQRVVNFVLRTPFQAVSLEGEARGATDGGRYGGESTANHLNIRDQRRWSFDIGVGRDTRLLESERQLLDARAGEADLVGNVFAPISGAEIDPALSALAGEPVTVAGAPDDAAFGPVALSAFAAGVANETDTTPFRTLEPRSDNVALGATYSDRVSDKVTATATASVDYTATEAFSGLAEGEVNLPANSPFSPFANDVAVSRFFGTLGPLVRETQNWDAVFSTLVNRNGENWQVTLETEYARRDFETQTDREVDVSAFQADVSAGLANPFGPIADSQGTIVREEARTLNQQGGLETVVTGALFDLPAGALNLTIESGGEIIRLKSTSDAVGSIAETRLARDQGHTQINLDAPLLDGAGKLPWLGQATLSGNARFDHLSDFGTLWTYGYSMSWRPVDGVQFLASATHEEGAPSIQQLGDPIIRTPNVRVFDFATGETLDTVTQVSGGAPDLLNDERRVWRLNFSAKPFEESELRVSASYTDQKTENAIQGFPGLTPDIETAFPDRFLRADTGTLLEIDARPVNFAETRQRVLRYGFDWSKRLAASPPNLSPEERAKLRQMAQERRAKRDGARSQNASADLPGTGSSAESPGRPAASGPPAGGRGAGAQSRSGRPGGGPGGRRRGGRMGVSVFHNITLADSVLTAIGQERLDLLSGDAVSVNGGASRHEIEARAGYFKNGVGIRTSFNWRSGTTIDDGAAGVLQFSDIGTADVRLFFDPARRPKVLLNYPWLRGMRFSVEVENLLNDRQEVRDETGATPVGFQKAFLDPTGRAVIFSIRRFFF